MKNQDPQTEFYELEKFLSDAGVFALSEEKKLRMKRNIMARIENQESFSLVNSMSSIAEKVSLTLERRAIVKERLFESIQEKSQKNYFWQRFFHFNKKLVSFAMLFVLLFSFLSVVTVDTSVVRAGSLTTLDVFEGDVYLMRGGERIEMNAGMTLQEDDKLVTGKDGFAVVNYFGASLSRVAENSEVSFNSLYEDQFNYEQQIELDVTRGAVWSKVVNLINQDSEFVVRAKDLSAMANKNAVFNFKVIEDQVEVGVYGNAATVTSAAKTEKVVNGFKAVVDTEEWKVEEIEKEEKTTAWVQDNLESDKEFLMVAQQESPQEDKVGLREQALLFLTFDDVEKQKTGLDLAEKKFIAAQTELVEGVELTEVEEDFTAFADEVKNFYQVIDEVAEKDPEFADELRVYVDEKLLYQKKSLNLVLPKSPLYPAKEIVSDLVIESADDPEQIATLKTESAGDKLVEAQESLVIGDAEQTEAALEAYKEEIGEVIEIVDQAQVAAPVVEIETVVEDLAVIETLADSEEEGAELFEGVAVEVKMELKESLDIEIDEPVVVVEEPVEVETPEIQLPVKVVVPQEEKKYDIEILEDGKALPPALGL